MMAQNCQYSMKDTHRKLYPRWAFPFDYSPLQPTIAEGLRIAYNDMLLLIQDKVINQRALTSLVPYPQSSARMTPGPGSALFRREFITESAVDKFPAMVVPALHLPDDSCEDLRHVQVWAYELDDSHYIEKYLMNSMQISNKRISFVFQMSIKPKSLDSLSTSIDFQYHFWQSLTLKDAKPGISYRMYYRSAEDRLLPNPRILSTWRDVHGEEYRAFPWRGDVFILPFCPGASSTTMPIEDSSAIDSAGILRALERWFQYQGAGCPIEEEEFQREITTDLFKFVEETRRRRRFLDTVRGFLKSI
jgi:hypothetical protein